MQRQDCVLSNNEESLDLKRDMDKLLGEINEYFKKIFVNGVSSISDSTIQELQEFETRLNGLGANNLAFYLNHFIKKANQLKQNRSSELIFEVCETMVKILTFKRVFERVSTHQLIKQQLTLIIINESKESRDQRDQSEY